MNLLIALVLGLVGGAIGLGVGAALGSVLAAASNVTSREGAAGYFVVAISLLTGLASLVVSIVLALRWRGVTSFAAVTGGTVGTLVAIVGVTAGGIAVYYYSAELPLNSGGSAPRLEYEIRFTSPIPTELRDYSVEVHTPKYRPVGTLKKADSEDGGGSVLAGEVELYSRHSRRLFVLSLPGGENRLFQLRLPGNPTAAKYREWSEWRNADFLYKPGQKQPAKADSDASVCLRHRVRTLD